MLAEKVAWEKDLEKIQKASKKDSDVINLNIGGVELMTSIDVLKSDKGSNLEKMFSGNHEHKVIDGKVFIDRDGETFKTLVNYLRNEQAFLPDFETKNQELMFNKELQFWEIGEKYKEQKVPKKERNIDFLEDYTSPYANTMHTISLDT